MGDEVHQFDKSQAIFQSITHSNPEGVVSSRQGRQPLCDRFVAFHEPPSGVTQYIRPLNHIIHVFRGVAPSGLSFSLRPPYRGLHPCLEGVVLSGLGNPSNCSIILNSKFIIHNSYCYLCITKHNLLRFNRLNEKILFIHIARPVRMRTEPGRKKIQKETQSHDRNRGRHIG